MKKLFVLMAVIAMTNMFTGCGRHNNQGNVKDGGTAVLESINSGKKIAIIAAGQSNIDGRNDIHFLPSYVINPNPAIHFCNNEEGEFSDFEIRDGGEGKDWAFDSIVYSYLTSPEYGNLDEIYVIKKSMGGTSIDPEGATDYHWTTDFDKLEDLEHSLLLSFESIIKAARAAKGDDFEIVAMVWHQGEGDAQDPAVSARYYDNFTSMIQYVRDLVGNPELPIFTGSFSHKSEPYSPVVEEAQKRISSEDKNFHLVDMSESALKDQYHFNDAWSEYFGASVYDMMVDAGIVSGKKVMPEKP